MASDSDVYRAANLLLERYGSCALVEAARHAFALRDCGDVDGYRVWKRIVAVIGAIDEPRSLADLAPSPSSTESGASRPPAQNAW
jgi:hypothetical protein